MGRADIGDLFADQTPSGPLTVFHAQLTDTTQEDWRSLFEGYTELKAITFSSSLEFLVELAGQFEDLEIVFGSERILSKEHWALAQASQAAEAYSFSDLLADQKVFTEALGRYLGRHGKTLLQRVVDRTLRFRLLRKRPSHEKLYLLSGDKGKRVVTGSANLSAMAFEGRQQEVYISFDGAKAYETFSEYFERDYKESDAIDADLIVVEVPDGAPEPRKSSVDLNDTPVARVVKAGAVILEEAPRSVGTGFTAEAMREAEKLGAELRDLNLPKTKSGQTMINAQSLVRAIRQHQAKPIAEPSEDRITRAVVNYPSGEITLDGSLWLTLANTTVDAGELRRDAELITSFIESYSVFFGDAKGAVDHYWAFLVWLYGAPAAPYLRQAAIPAGIDPWIYPVYAVLYGRSSGGKTLFTRVAARSMFGFDKMIRSGVFTAVRTLGLRERLGAIPLLVDDVTRDKFAEHVPSLVRTDQELSDCYAPVVITTNKDVTAIPADISKRMMTCHIDAAIPENRSVAGQVARKITREIGTALYRAYLLRMIPRVREMRAEIDENKAGFPDLFVASSETLRELFQEALGHVPEWARTISFHDNFGIRHRKFSEQLQQILAEAEDRIEVNRKTAEIVIQFGGDTNQAAQFAKGVPDFVLKGRFADIVRLDLEAIEKEMRLPVEGGRSFWARLLRR